MFHSRELRFRDIITDIEESLTDLALEPRLMPGGPHHHHHHHQHQHSHLSPTATVVAAAPMSLAYLHSNASTPSLRSRDGTVPPHARTDPGGNVRVVVRVRAFLPRGMLKTSCLPRYPPRPSRSTC